MPEMRDADPVRGPFGGRLADDVLVPDLSGGARARPVIAIEVRCDGSAATGWACRVALRDGGREVSSHDVRVAATDLERLAPGASDPERLVEASFRFLLARESPASIVRAFDLPVIGRYVPEYEAEIRAAYDRDRV